MLADNSMKSFKILWMLSFVIIVALIGISFLIRTPILTITTSATALEILALAIVLLSQVAEVFWVKKTLNDASADKSDGALFNAYFTGSVISVSMLIAANIIGLIFSNLLNEPLRMIPVTAVSLYLLYRAKPQKDKILKNIEELKNDQ